MGFILKSVAHNQNPYATVKIVILFYFFFLKVFLAIQLLLPDLILRQWNSAGVEAREVTCGTDYSTSCCIWRFLAEVLNFCLTLHGPENLR